MCYFEYEKLCTQINVRKSMFKRRMWSKFDANEISVLREPIC